MATAQELEAALVNADKAGDVQAAQMLAAELVRVRQGSPMGGGRPLPANSWAITGNDPAVGQGRAALIGAGRTGSQVQEGVNQIGLSANVAGRQALGMESGDQLRALAAQEAQQKEADRLYAPLKKEFPIATGFGEATPAIGIPMGAGGAMSRVMTPAAGMALMEAMKYGSPQERAAKGVTGLATGLGGGLVQEGVSRAIMPLQGSVNNIGQNLISELSARVGAKPLPSQLTNSPSLARYEDMLARMPGSADVMGNFIRENQNAVNSRAAGAIGETGAPDAATLGAANTRVGANFNALRQNATMPSSQPIFDAINDAKKMLAAGDPKAGGKPEAAATLQRLEDALYATKQFSGDEYKSWVSDLRSAARSTDNATVGAALKRVSKAMDSEAKANTASTVDAQGNPVTWQQADSQWAALKALLKPHAVNQETGDVNAAAIARGLQQDFGDAAKMGRLQGPMADIAAYGRGVPQLRAGSPTAERGETNSLAGLLKALPRWAAAHAITSPALSEYLTKGLLGAPEISKPLSLLAGKAAFPASAGLLDADLYALLLGLPVMSKQQ